MSAHFDPSLSTKKDWIRHYVGDTDDDSALVQDETIEALLSKFSFRHALVSTIDAVISKLSKEPDSISEGSGSSFSWRERIAALQTLRKRAEAGQIPDPDTGEPQKSVSVAAKNEFF